MVTSLGLVWLAWSRLTRHTAETMKKRVNIIAKGNGWDKAPAGGERWGLNSHVLVCPFTRLFNMHNWKFIPEGELTGINLAGYENVEVVTQANFPLEEIVEAFGTNYFSNTICYMLALALYEGYDDIHMYGVYSGEDIIYLQKERPGVEYWLGIANGIGVDVTIHGNHRLLTTDTGFMYGYHSVWELGEQDARYSH